MPNQSLTSQFPTHPNREFFAALQGIKSGDQGKFRPDQGIPLSSAIWASACRQSDRPDRSRTYREGEQRRRQMLEVPEADLERGFVRPRRAANRSPERVDANDRAFRALRWRCGSVACARVHRAHRRGGTEGSNPAPSTGESRANLTSSIRRQSRSVVSLAGDRWFESG